MLYGNISNINIYSNCLKALTSVQKDAFIPVRTSKLTYFLEDSLNSKSKIMILCMISNKFPIK